MGAGPVEGGGLVEEEGDDAEEHRGEEREAVGVEGERLPPHRERD